MTDHPPAIVLAQQQIVRSPPCGHLDGSRLVEHIEQQDLSGSSCRRSATPRTILAPLGMRSAYFFAEVLEGTRAALPAVANGYIRLTKSLTDAVAFNPGFTSPRPG